MTAHIVLQHVSKKFGALTAVDDVSVSIDKGEFFSFLGPSGCGKTTILRLISGFAEPTSGTIAIAGQDMRGIGPNKRPTALIFQSLALFPLMPVWENIAFGLEMRGMGRQERRKRADELLSLVELGGAADKNPAELSGGQRQRVAIARALAVEPEVLLLDEPLSALDLKLRQHMRAELRKIQRRTGVTFIYITHDQGEALTMSDRVAVMSNGRIEQIAAPTELYNDPATPFVASFVGGINYFRGQIQSATAGQATIQTAAGVFTGRNARGLGIGDQAILFIRPEHMRIVEQGAEAANALTASFSHVDFEGNVTLIHFDGDGERSIIVQIAGETVIPVARPGDWKRLSFSPAQAVVLPASELARE